ncbi:Thaumatin-like protein [Thalictrum thalictroides]|uniref:Thaumatin-like protein n=1 Tax=Thalictrum thalictroides TaxID=46969 RepID=A0A7J6WRN5_THATH|nr:Thaumatin-like protein [Thalictrum thalictroides]
MAFIPLVGVYIVTFSLLCCSISCSFTIINNCPHTIWPGTLAGAGTPQLSTTGFQLNSGQSVKIASVPGWSGRIWARTGCTFDESGTGTCQTGDCGGKLECNGNGAKPPASLFEITLGKGNDKDYYDVSIVDGYNLPLIATPLAVGGGCNTTGCVYDLNLGCPKELQIINDVDASGTIACKSACEAFGIDQYCCRGEYANPTSCRPSFYSTIFKRACPRAYSYAFDDGTSTFTCNAYEYTITFCPATNGLRKSDGAPPPPALPVLPALPAPFPALPTPAPALPIRDHNYGEVVGLLSSANILSFRTSIIFLLILNFYCLSEL